MSACEALCEQLSVARESALQGEYATASVYYEGVSAQITRCVPLRSSVCTPCARG